MAFNSQNLSVLAYANGFTLWHYTTADPAATVDTAGYFNSAAGMLRLGDMIFANVATAGTPGAGVYHVRVNSGGTVDVSNITSIGDTNTD